MPSFYLYFLFSYFASAALCTLDIKTTNNALAHILCAALNRQWHYFAGPLGVFQ